MRYFLDTYAMIEIVKGNTSYDQYVDADLFTTLLNLYELYYNLLRDHGETTAKTFFTEFSRFLMPMEEKHIFSASVWKLAHRRIAFSYADALGFSIAQAEGMLFLTGDKEFKRMTSVEFVK